MKILPILLMVLFLGLGAHPNYKEPIDAKGLNNIDNPKNIILMIGDGMGITQISAGMYSGQGKMALESFPVIGLHKSYAANNLITDSAAGATAFACGVKTYNGAIGVDEDTTRVQSILEEAENNGLATGLVSTSTIVHATPASFIAHIESRQRYEEIAAQFLDTEIDFFVGGGKKFFDRRTIDERNLYSELEGNGYVVSDSFKSDFSGRGLDFSRNYAFFTADNNPLPYSEGRNYLVNATRVAPEFLKVHSEEKGFFLMIEGSQISLGGQENDRDYIVSEMKEFNIAIQAAFDFAKKDGETLLVVTANHETGGFSINPGSQQDSIIAGFTSGNQTGSMIPVFAYGPKSEIFAGIYENTAIHSKMRLALGFAESGGKTTK